MRNRADAGAGALAITAAIMPGAALAQRAGENAVAAASDAFGTTVGNEVIGIYSENDTRGFSPVKAGNARIEGVYYDPVGALSGRLRASTMIRVGLAAETFPLNAPTGVVDYQFRPFPDQFGTSLGYQFAAFGGFIRDFDLRLPMLGNRVGLTGGIAQADLRQSDGARNQSWGVTIRPIVRLGKVEFAPFAAVSTFTSNHTHPLVVVTDENLPALPPKRRYLGQKWAEGRYENRHLGATLRAPLGERLSLRAGLFHAVGDRARNFTEIFAIAGASGLAAHRLIADPAHDIHSTSGEALLSLRLGGGGAHTHRLIAGYRARNRYTETGGSDIRSFGLAPFGEPDPQPEPDFAFSAVNAGRVRQASWMLGYLGQLGRRLRVNLGVQKARYRADFREGRTGLDTTSRDSPWLYNATVAWDVVPAVAVYAGTQRGLEDSGAAPENAANRNEQLPATRTRQIEGGVRWRFRQGQLAASLFQITKPYFAFDAASRFVEAGTVRHRGAEASLSGRFGPRLNLLAGALLMRPRVTGAARDLGLVGPRPAGTPSLLARIDVNYRSGIFGGLTPTATLVHTSARAAGARPLAALGGRQLTLPAYTTVDLGLRQQFTLGRVPASFRAVLQNALDAKTWKVVAANTLYPEERRRFVLNVTADF
jgi:iron complex outermembrane receptor protein